VSAPSPFAAVVLAAGLGKRMNSDLPKVLHPALGRPLLLHVLEQLDPLGPQQTIVVVGHRAPLVREALVGRRVVFAEQVPQLGTGHAVQMAWPALETGPDTLLVLAGDMPLIRTATLKRLLERHRREGNAVTFLSGDLADPSGYGRVVRDARGDFIKIVEEKDATPGERALSEVNSGIYCFSREPLREALGFLRADNRQQEYYLTDTLSFIKGRGGRIGVERASDARELLGVNDPEQLAMVEEALLAWGAS
jgi:bifunctional UDP-N-acetylglucosamine pyrophosphorylase/glucosamine-1-phosphate N-acetyltransferase